MAAAPYNFVIEQGTTWEPVLRVLQDDGTTPVDITGWTFAMQIREEDQDGDLVAELTTGNAKIIIEDAADGKFSLLLTDAETGAFTEAQFEAAVYDLESRDAGGSVKRLLQGSVGLSLNITRPGP